MLNQNFENCFLTRSDPDLLYSEREKIEKRTRNKRSFCSSLPPP